MSSKAVAGLKPSRRAQVLSGGKGTSPLCVGQHCHRHTHLDLLLPTATSNEIYTSVVRHVSANT